mmetsp:Transcript_19745/g.47891  ORF Transcript_19745/g.47891 Transcript_19745/m.47891 type:complete len:227 (+) Transcript_19745:44-724(+)
MLLLALFLQLVLLPCGLGRVCLGRLAGSRLIGRHSTDLCARLLGRRSLEAIPRDAGTLGGPAVVHINIMVWIISVFAPSPPSACVTIPHRGLMVIIPTNNPTKTPLATAGAWRSVGLLLGGGAYTRSPTTTTGTSALIAPLPPLRAALPAVFARAVGATRPSVVVVLIVLVVLVVVVVVLCAVCDEGVWSLVGGLGALVALEQSERGTARLLVAVLVHVCLHPDVE